MCQLHPKVLLKMQSGKELVVPVAVRSMMRTCHTLAPAADHAIVR